MHFSKSLVDCVGGVDIGIRWIDSSSFGDLGDTSDNIFGESLESNSGSGCCDSYTGFWCRVGSGSNLVDIQSFLEIGKIGDSGRVSGRARETSEIDECYGSENNKDSDNDDEFDEGESEKTNPSRFHLATPSQAKGNNSPSA